MTPKTLAVRLQYASLSDRELDRRLDAALDRMIDGVEAEAEQEDPERWSGME